MPTTVQLPQLVDVKLKTSGQQQDDNGGSAPETQRLRPQTSGPMKLRYFKIGRKSDKVLCPMCREESAVEMGQMPDVCLPGCQCLNCLWYVTLVFKYLCTYIFM